MKIEYVSSFQKLTTDLLFHFQRLNIKPKCFTGQLTLNIWVQRSLYLATSHPTKTGLKGQFAGLNVTAVFQSLRLERGCTCMKEGGYWKEGIYI